MIIVLFSDFVINYLTVKYISRQKLHLITPDLFTIYKTEVRVNIDSQSRQSFLLAAFGIE